MGGVQPAPVGHGRHHVSHLDGRAENLALADGEVQRAEHAARLGDASRACIGGQVDAGRHAEAERPAPTRQRLPAGPEAGVIEVDVAGMLDRRHQRERAVAPSGRAVPGAIPEHLRPGTGERRLRDDCPLLQRRRGRHHLVDRTRRQRRLQGSEQQRVMGIGQKLLEVVSVSAQVVARVGCGGEHGAVPDVNKDQGAALEVELFLGSGAGEGRVSRPLEVLPDGQVDVASTLGRDRFRSSLHAQHAEVQVVQYVSAAAAQRTLAGLLDAAHAEAVVHRVAPAGLRERLAHRPGELLLDQAVPRLGANGGHAADDVRA